MSSKIQGPRSYACQRCLNHGKKVPLKRHRLKCPHRNCDCDLCAIINERKKYNAELSLIRNALDEDDDSDIPPKRGPICSRCAAHGQKASFYTHFGRCPFLNCSCTRCALIKRHRSAMAKQTHVRRKQKALRKSEFQNCGTNPSGKNLNPIFLINNSMDDTVDNDGNDNLTESLDSVRNDEERLQTFQKASSLISGSVVDKGTQTLDTCVCSKNETFAESLFPEDICLTPLSCSPDNREVVGNENPTSSNSLNSFQSNPSSAVFKSFTPEQTSLVIALMQNALTLSHQNLQKGPVEPKPSAFEENESFQPQSQLYQSSAQPSQALHEAASVATDSNIDDLLELCQPTYREVNGDVRQNFNVSFGDEVLNLDENVSDECFRASSRKFAR